MSKPCAIIAVPDRGNSPVLRLALAFVDIVLHRRGPDTLPASKFLLGLVIGVYLLTAFVALALACDPDLLTLTVDRAFRLHELQAENERLREELNELRRVPRNGPGAP